MKIWKKVLLIVLAVLLLALAGVCIWQWDNIQAAYRAVTRDADTIANDLDRVHTDYRDTIREEIQVEFQPPTLEQSEGLISGTKSPDDVKAELGILPMLPERDNAEADAPPDDTVSDDASDAEAPPAASTDAEPAPPTAQELLDRCVAELTSCQIDLMALLGEMKLEAETTWVNLQPEERTLTKKKEIILAGLNECYALEAVVDEQVRGILDRYGEELTAIGADDRALDTLWDYYETEKAAQKAYYLNKFLYNN